MVAFFFALPLILIVACLVVYPAFYSMHLATLNKSMTKFVGLGNFEFLFKRNTFWMVVEQSVLFAVTAVVFKAVIGFVVAHFVHNIPLKGQRKWRGMLLIPWVIPPAMSTLAFADVPSGLRASATTLSAMAQRNNPPRPGCRNHIRSPARRVQTVSFI